MIYAFDKNGNVIFPISKIVQNDKDDIYCYTEVMQNILTDKLAGSSYTVEQLEVPIIPDGIKLRSKYDVEMYFTNLEIKNLQNTNAELILALVEGDIL